MRRSDWLCLNGEWEFEIDNGDSGLERGLLTRNLGGRIVVPFCPESELSGIGHTDFLNAVWYRRELVVPAEWGDRRVRIHFQAVDYDATVWASVGPDGAMIEVARHRGGFGPFHADLGKVAGQGITIVVRARDYRDGPQPRGKQSIRYGNWGCSYTRTTGIWQTVWLEPLPETALKRPRIVPDVGAGHFVVTVGLEAGGPGPHADGLRLRMELRAGGESLVTRESVIEDFAPGLVLPIPEGERRLWSPEDPFLYSIGIQILDSDGAVLDEVESYAGLRSVQLRGRDFLLNGKPVFQKLVLDQGYYADGIMTAPGDDALARDIELSLEAGFNGARLHQKVFEERFLYHADRLGYLVWGEFGDWGADADGPGLPNYDHKNPGATYITQWLEILERDCAHPSIIGWCPMNEQGQLLNDRITVLDDVMRGMFLATKAMDPTRPVLDSSGWSHRVRESDIYDTHDYEPDPERLSEKNAGLEVGNEPEAVAFWTREKQPGVDSRRNSLPYGGQPYFLSEFGGMKWTGKETFGEEGWGYGQPPKTLDEFYERFEGQCQVLIRDPGIFGYCYTQLTDVFQEQNGIYYFDRSPKFDPERLRSAQRVE